ncbi:hypothetical protein ACT3UD_18210 [Glutamicibacter sp. 287]|uniref:hypothetical protein n=1 Tax=unclassified Glutamicibacter TaxID=2627139 RepID=UPI0040344194
MPIFLVRSGYHAIMNIHSNRDKFLVNWQKLDRQSMSLGRRTKYYKYRIAAFIIYILAGLVIADFGGSMLATPPIGTTDPSVAPNEASLGYATLSFGVAIVAVGFTFLGFQRDKGMEEVTAGTYLLLRAMLEEDNPALSVAKVETECCDSYQCQCADELPAHGRSCECHCMVADLQSKGE